MYKALTFLFALIMALSMTIGLGQMGTNLMSFSSCRELVGTKAYAAILVYSEILLAFICMFLAGLLTRSRPVVLGVVYVVSLMLVHLVWTPSMGGSRHFWIRTVLGCAAGVGGAWLAVAAVSRAGKREPVHPVWAGVTALLLLAATWVGAWLAMMQTSFSRSAPL